MVKLLYDPGLFERVEPDRQGKIVCIGIFQLCDVPNRLQYKISHSELKFGVDYAIVSDCVFFFVGIRISNNQNSIDQYKSFCEFFEEHFNNGHVFGELVYRKINQPIMNRYFQIYDMVKQYELSN